MAYTFSKLMSDYDESLGVGAITAGTPQIPQDFFNIKPEKSVSAFDRKRTGSLQTSSMKHRRRRAAQQELARYQFTSDETIKPGKSKEVSVLYLVSPVKLISAQTAQEEGFCTY